MQNFKQYRRPQVILEDFEKEFDLYIEQELKKSVHNIIRACCMSLEKCDLSEDYTIELLSSARNIIDTFVTKAEEDISIIFFQIEKSHEKDGDDEDIHGRKITEIGDAS